MQHATYKQALAFRKKYEATVKEFQGIITPIRAMVIHVDPIMDTAVAAKQLESGFQEIARKAFYAAANYGVTKCVQTKKKLTWCSTYQDLQDLEGFIAESKIVGYVAAVVKDGVINYGMSYCQDADYDEFNPDLGKYMAMSRAMNSKCIMSDVLFDDMDVCNYGTGSSYMYLWPITYGQQLKHFTARCEKYFKQLKIQPTAKKVKKS